MNKVKILAKLAVLFSVVALSVVIEQPVESLPAMPADATARASNQDAFVYLPLLYTSCGPGELRFSDDFSDPNSGWPTWDDDQTQASYLNGEFRLLLKVEEGLAGLTNNSASGSDYLLTADVRNATGLPGQYGLLFGFDSDYDISFYTFEITPSGHYFVYFHVYDPPDPMQTTLLQTGWSSIIRTGMQTNNLAVLHRPNAIELYANDQLVTNLPTGSWGSEANGMWATSTTEPNLDVRFDNFEVYQYECYRDTHKQESVRQSGETDENHPFTWRGAGK